MENLFIEPLEHEKCAMVRVSDDTTKWVKEIISLLLSTFPELSNSALQVSYHQKDANKGFAVASVQGDGFSIPAIISDFQLMPLDVIIINSVMLPLTKEVLLDVMSNGSAFESVAKGRKELTTQVFGSPLSIPTNTTGTNFNTGTLSHNFIDKVSSFVEKRDYDRLIAEITRPEHYAGFVKNETLDVVEKVASLKASSEVDFAEATLANLDIDRQLLVEDELGNKHVKQANSRLDYTWKLPLDVAETMPLKLAHSEPSLEELKPTRLGNTYPIASGILYLTKEGEYYVFDKQAHSQITERVQTFEVAGDMPSMNDYGVFVVDNEATAPFEVVGLQKVAGTGNFEVVGWDGLTRTTYIPLRGITKSAMIPHEEYTNTYYVPGNGKFVKLAGELRVTFEAIDNDLKPNYVERDEAGLYSVSGPGFTKYGETHSLRDLTEMEAKWIAIHCGAVQKDLEKVAKLVPNSHAKLAGDITSPITTTELESIIETAYDKLISEVPDIQTLLVKEAAGLSNKNSVDAILSLGLMNKRNALEYISYLENYEQCLSELAKLLVAARLGMPNTDPYDVKEAMEALAKVIYALKGLKAIVDSTN